MNPLIDCDVHPKVPDIPALIPYMSESWQEWFLTTTMFQIAEREGGPPSTSGSDDPKALADQLFNGYGIQAAVLLSLQAGTVAGWVDHLRAAAFVSAVNDYMVDNWLPSDPRFRLAITVAPHDPERAVAEIERHSETREVVAVSLPLLNTLLGERHYAELLGAAERAQLPVLIHPTGTEGIVAGAPTFAGGVPEDPAVQAVLISQVAQSNLASLIYEGVFDRWKGLRVVFADCGIAWIAPAVWALETFWRENRRMLPALRRSPTSYVHDHIRFTIRPAEFGHESHHLWSLVESSGIDQFLLFGSDYPYGDPDRALAQLGQLPNRSREAISHGNAVSLFGKRVADLDGGQRDAAGRV